MYFAQSFQAQAQKRDLKAEAVNCFFPAIRYQAQKRDLKVDYETLREYEAPSKPKRGI